MEQQIRALLERWAYLNEHGEQVQTMNANEVGGLIAELAQLTQLTGGYQWAVKVTIEYLDGNGVVERAASEIHECHSKAEAVARHDTALDVIEGRTSQPRWTQLAGSELLRRPTGEWEKAA